MSDQEVVAVTSSDEGESSPEPIPMKVDKPIVWCGPWGHGDMILEFRKANIVRTATHRNPQI